MVTVYSKPACVQCNATYRKLDTLGVPYTVIDMSEDADALAEVKALGYQQAPVVVAPDGRHWSGFNPSELDSLAA